MDFSDKTPPQGEGDRGTAGRVTTRPGTRICYIGDDIIDPAFEICRVGYLTPSLRQARGALLPEHGRQGAVRETVELILKALGRVGRRGGEIHFLTGGTPAKVHRDLHSQVPGFPKALGVGWLPWCPCGTRK